MFEATMISSPRRWPYFSTGAGIVVVALVIWTVLPMLIMERLEFKAPAPKFTVMPLVPVEKRVRHPAHAPATAGNRATGGGPAAGDRVVTVRPGTAAP